MTRAVYTSEAWATVIKNPKNHLEQMWLVVEGQGGAIKAAKTTVLMSVEEGLRPAYGRNMLGDSGAP